MSLSLLRLRILRTQCLSSSVVIALTRARRTAHHAMQCAVDLRIRLSHRQHLVNYALDGSQDVFLVVELHVHRFDSTSTFSTFDPDVIRGVDHDFGHLGVPNQFCYGTESEQAVCNQFGCLALDSFTFLGKGCEAACICHSPIPEHDDAVGCLIGKGVSGFAGLWHSGPCLLSRRCRISIKHGYSSD